MWLSAKFIDASGPLLALTPTITVYNLTDASEDVSAQPMVAVGTGLYKYNFSTINHSKEYVFVCDGGAVITSPFLRYSYGAIEANETYKLTGHDVKKSGDVITIYESDGITVWRRYNLASGGRIKL